MENSVGIIANPASGKDIRRFVAHASTFDNQEKINILVRVFSGLEAFGVNKVYALADPFGLVILAYEKSKSRIPLVLSDFPLENSSQDSTQAASWMVQQSVACIITLGGDGTNRVVAKASANTPLLPLSTGTNNVFPSMTEGTLAGIAAAAVSAGIDQVETAIVQKRCLHIYKNENKIDLALIDAVIYADLFRGSGAIWDPGKILGLILAERHAAVIGAAAIANSLDVPTEKAQAGIWVEVGGEAPIVMVPFAPGLILPIPIKAVHWLSVGDRVPLHEQGATLALDGERDLYIREQDHFEVCVSDQGPRVVMVDQVLEIARQNRFFHKIKEVASH
jgi:hypothetical protein